MMTSGLEQRNQPPLSIITVCFNERKRIRLTCESIVTQTYQNFEWLVIDGGSTDGTVEILKQYQRRMDLFISEADRGIYHAMNKGIEAARGDYLLFLNGGDYLYEKNVLGKVFENPLSKDVYYGDLILEKKDRNRRYFVNFSHPYRKFTEKTLPHQASFIRKSLFKSYGNYNEAFPIAADLDFFLRVFVSNQRRKSHTICYLPFIIASYENYDGLSSNPQCRENVRLENERVRKEHYPCIYLWIRQKMNVIEKKYTRFFLRAKQFLNKRLFS